VWGSNCLTHPSGRGRCSSCMEARRCSNDGRTGVDWPSSGRSASSYEGGCELAMSRRPGDAREASRSESAGRIRSKRAARERSGCLARSSLEGVARARPQAHAGSSNWNSREARERVTGSGTANRSRWKGSRKLCALSGMQPTPGKPTKTRGPRRSPKTRRRSRSALTSWHPARWRDWAAL